MGSALKRYEPSRLTRSETVELSCGKLFKLHDAFAETEKG